MTAGPRRTAGLALCAAGALGMVVGAVGLAADDGGDGAAVATTTTAPPVETSAASATSSSSTTTTETTTTTTDTTAPAEAPSATAAMALAACTSFDGAPPQQPDELRSGVADDPRIDRERPFAGFSFVEPLPSTELAGLPPFTVAVLLDDPATDLPPRTDGPAVDRLGDVQLWLSWDGDATTKVARHRTEAGWEEVVDDSSEDVTALLQLDEYRTFSDEIADGWRFAGAVAQLDDAGDVACAASGLDADDQPATPVDLPEGP